MQYGLEYLMRRISPDTNAETATKKKVRCNIVIFQVKWSAFCSVPEGP